MNMDSISPNHSNLHASDTATQPQPPNKLLHGQNGSPSRSPSMRKKVADRLRRTLHRSSEPREEKADSTKLGRRKSLIGLFGSISNSPRKQVNKDVSKDEIPVEPSLGSDRVVNISPLPDIKRRKSLSGFIESISHKVSTMRGDVSQANHEDMKKSAEAGDRNVVLLSILDAVVPAISANEAVPLLLTNFDLTANLTNNHFENSPQESVNGLKQSPRDSRTSSSSSSRWYNHDPNPSSQELALVHEAPVEYLEQERNPTPDSYLQLLIESCRPAIDSTSPLRDCTSPVLFTTECVSTKLGGHLENDDSPLNVPLYYTVCDSTSIVSNPEADLGSDNESNVAQNSSCGSQFETGWFETLLPQRFRCGGPSRPLSNAVLDSLVLPNSYREDLSVLGIEGNSNPSNSIFSSEPTQEDLHLEQRQSTTQRIDSNLAKTIEFIHTRDIKPKVRTHHSFTSRFEMDENKVWHAISLGRERLQYTRYSSPYDGNKHWLQKLNPRINLPTESPEDSPSFSATTKRRNKSGTPEKRLWKQFRCKVSGQYGPGRTEKIGSSSRCSEAQDNDPTHPFKYGMASLGSDYLLPTIDANGNNSSVECVFHGAKDRSTGKIHVEYPSVIGQRAHVKSYGLMEEAVEAMQTYKYCKLSDLAIYDPRRCTIHGRLPESEVLDSCAIESFRFQALPFRTPLARTAQPSCESKISDDDIDNSSATNGVKVSETQAANLDLDGRSDCRSENPNDMGEADADARLPFSQSFSLQSYPLKPESSRSISSSEATLSSSRSKINPLNKEDISGPSVDPETLYWGDGSRPVSPAPTWAQLARDCRIKAEKPLHRDDVRAVIGSQVESEGSLLELLLGEGLSLIRSQEHTFRLCPVSKVFEKFDVTDGETHGMCANCGALEQLHPRRSTGGALYHKNHADFQLKLTPVVRHENSGSFESKEAESASGSVFSGSKSSSEFAPSSKSPSFYNQACLVPLNTSENKSVGDQHCANTLEDSGTEINTGPLPASGCSDDVGSLQPSAENSSDNKLDMLARSQSLAQFDQDDNRGLITLDLFWSKQPELDEDHLSSNLVDITLDGSSQSIKLGSDHGVARSPTSSRACSYDSSCAQTSTDPDQKYPSQWNLSTDEFGVGLTYPRLGFCLSEFPEHSNHAHPAPSICDVRELNCSYECSEGEISMLSGFKFSRHQDILTEHFNETSKIEGRDPELDLLSEISIAESLPRAFAWATSNLQGLQATGSKTDTPKNSDIAGDELQPRKNNLSVEDLVRVLSILETKN